LHNIVVYRPCVWWRAQFHKYHESIHSASFSVNTWPGQNILYSDSLKCVLLIEGKYRMSSVLTFLIFWERFFMKLQKNTRKIKEWQHTVF